MKVVHYRQVKNDDPNIKYIGRPGPLGNPFRMRVDTELERELVVDEYRIWFNKQVERDPIFRQMILDLRGYDLSCWCAPKPCHGDVIVAWLETQKNKT